MTRADSKVVLLDWNGTVVLDAERARRSLNIALSEVGVIEVTTEEFPRVFRLPMATMFSNLGVPPDRIDQAELAWNVAMSRDSAPGRAGLEELLSRNWRLGVISAAQDISVLADMNRLGCESRWGSIATAVADKVAVLRAARGDETEAIYVGDTAYDMEAASTAGFTPVGVRGGYASEEVLLQAGASRLIASLAEL